jgi:hypothetical protein
MRGRSVARLVARLVGAPAAFAFIALASSARADVPKYGELPSGHVTLAPKAKAPAFVAAHERVPGLFVVSQKFPPETPAHVRHVTVVADAKIADAIRAGEGFERVDAESGTCFAEAGNHRMRMDDDDEASSREWNTSQMWQLNLWPRSRDNDAQGVTAIHSERLVESGGKVSLETIDAWVDPSTRGARLITKASLPLTLVGSAVGGLKVYAARDERDGGKRFVQFVVARPSASSAAGSRSMMAVRQDGLGSHGSGCGHLRMALAAEPKAGDSAVALVPVELPPLGGERRDASSESGGAAAAKAPPPPPAAALGPRSVLRRLKQRGAPPSSGGEPKERELRTREMQVHLSVSQTSNDKEPLLAVSFGWSGREQVQRVFDGPSDAPPME